MGRGKQLVTKDGVKKKKGDLVWERAWNDAPEISPLVPEQSIVGKDLEDPENCWDKYDNCMNSCNEYNAAHGLKPATNPVTEN